MNNKFLLSATLLASSFFATAQNASRTYAITGKENNNFLWADIKQVDIATGKVVKTLFEADKTAFKSIDLDKSGEISKTGATTTNPTAFGVAACALDTKHNRLYFTPMHFSDLRYLDLDQSEANFTTVKRNIISIPSNTSYQPEENQITRMVFAADGYGYALTNDGNHLIRFNTGKRAQVEDLGNLIDAEANKGISVHNRCTSWGGDMVADAFGKLVFISASHNVFIIDVASRIATYSGAVTGLPENFTTNGAAVDNDGNMIVSSANVFDALYKVNMKDLKAERVQSTEKPFNASDLANGNFLSQKEADAAIKFSALKPAIVAAATDAKVFPNPVTGSEFNVLFDGQKAGKYTILLTDLAGRSLQTKVVSLTTGSETVTVRLAKKTAHGMYLVKVLDESKQVTLSEKVVIE